MASYYIDFSAGTNGSGTSGSPWNRWTDTQSASLVAGDTLYLRGRCMTTSNKAQFGSSSFTNLPANCSVKDWPGYAPAVFNAVCDLPTSGWVNVTGNQWKLAGATVLATLNSATVGTGAGLSLANVAAIAAAVNNIIYQPYSAAADAGNLDSNAAAAPMCYFGKPGLVATTAATAWATAVDTNGDVYLNIPGAVSPNGTYTPDWSRWFVANAGASGAGLPATLPNISLVISSGGSSGLADYLRFTATGLRWSAKINASHFFPDEDLAGYIIQVTSGTNNVFDGITAACASYHAMGATSGDNNCNIFRNCRALQTCRSNVSTSTSVFVFHTSGQARSTGLRNRTVHNGVLWNCTGFGNDLLSAARDGSARSGANSTLGCDILYCHGDAGSSRVNSVLVVGCKFVLGNIASSQGKWSNPGGMSDQTWSVTTAGGVPPIPQHHNIWIHNSNILYSNLAGNTTDCPRMTLTAYAYSNCHFNLSTPGNIAFADPETGGGKFRGMVGVTNTVLCIGCLFTGVRNSYNVWFALTQASGTYHANFRKCTFAFESSNTANYHFLVGIGDIVLTSVAYNLVFRSCVIDMNMTKACLCYVGAGNTSAQTLANVQATLQFMGCTYLTPSGATWRWFGSNVGVENASLAMTQGAFTTAFENGTLPETTPNYNFGTRNAAHFDTLANGCKPLAGCVLSGVPGYADLPMAHPLLPVPVPTGLGKFEGSNRGCWPIDIANYGLGEMGQTAAYGVVQSLSPASNASTFAATSAPFVFIG